MKYASLISYFIVSVLVNYVTGKPTGKPATTNCHDVPGYYWRDYTGEVPCDAIPGGTDTNGRTTYIGQTLHPGNTILPGKITEDKQTMVYEFGLMEHAATQDVKILCSQHPEKLQWISTERGRSVASTGIGKTFVLGGHDVAGPLAIGRKTISTGELTVSKVLIINYNFENIYLADNGKGWADIGPYEVLVYNPSGSVDDQNGDQQEVITINFN